MELVLPIVLDVIAPILLMVLAGAVLRAKFRLDIGTLTKINIYVFVPAFVFHKVATSTLSWSDMGGVVAATVLYTTLLGATVWGIGRLLGISRRTLAAIALAVMFYNSGNFGLPLAELAYPREQAALTGKDGGAVQAFVLMTQNVLTFTVGLVLAGIAHKGVGWESAVRILRQPVLPMLFLALTARWWIGQEPGRHLPTMIEKATGYLANGLVPVALVTLGAQLANNPRWPRWRPVSLVLVLRLVCGPALMAGMLWALSFAGIPALNLWNRDGWPAELLILTSAVPTAVNTLLLTLELEGDADLAADCVFWTTITSVVTITCWLVVLWVNFV